MNYAQEGMRIAGQNRSISIRGVSIVFLRSSGDFAVKPFTRQFAGVRDWLWQFLRQVRKTQETKTGAIY
jgi:hypothetical protein